MSQSLTFFTRTALIEKFFSSLLSIAMGTLLLTLSAGVSIKLPFSPIPISLAPHVALLLGALLGKKHGSIAVLGYLAEGALGWPVFSSGNSGIAFLLGPNGGYLIGYLLGAYVTGHFFESSTNLLKMARAFLLGNLSIYALGFIQLSLFIGMKSALLLGVAPFLIGDFIKTLIALRGLKMKTGESYLQ